MLLVIFLVLWYSLYFFSDKLKFDDSNFAGAILEESTWSWDLDELPYENDPFLDSNSVDDVAEEPNQNAAINKYDVLKNNELYKKSIDTWDSFFVENKLISALKNYQTAQKIIPVDKELELKIWDVYYELKNYKFAFKHYKGNDTVPGFSKSKEVLSLFYWYYELWEEDIEALKTELQTLKFEEQEWVYYLNSLQCIVDFSKCKQFFKDYFYSPENLNIEFEELQRIKDGLEAYDNSETDDINYKNALVIGKFFENRQYPIVLRLWNELLEEFPDYESVIQMVAKSYYELWLYDEAHNILKPLHERKLSDAKISYFMWVINIRRKLFLSSSIYFNKALESWYEPVIDAKRKLVYNYFLIDNKEKMYLRLNDLLYEEGVAESDFALWIYQALQDEKFDFALDYAKRGTVNFPETARFYGYIADIYMRVWKYDLATSALETWKRLDPLEPSIVYYEWKIAFANKDYNKAFITFKRVISLSRWEWEFVESAKVQLDAIADAKAKEKAAADAEKKKQEELKKQQQSVNNGV